MEPDALADAAGRNAFSNRLDQSGAILMRDDAGKGHGEIAARAAAALGVGGVYRRRPDPDEHFARAGRRPVELADDQNLAGGALAVVPGGSHGRCRMAVSRCEMSRVTSRPARDRSAETGSFLLIPPDERWRGLGHALIRNARGKALLTDRSGRRPFQQPPGRGFQGALNWISVAACTRRSGPIRGIREGRCACHFLPRRWWC